MSQLLPQPQPSADCDPLQAQLLDIAQLPDQHPRVKDWLEAVNTRLHQQARTDLWRAAIGKTLEEIWSKRASFDPEKGSFGGWLSVIHQSNILDEKRKARKKCERQVEDVEKVPKDHLRGQSDPDAGFHRLRKVYELGRPFAQNADLASTRKTISTTALWALEWRLRLAELYPVNAWREAATTLPWQHGEGDLVLKEYLQPNKAAWSRLGNDPVVIALVSTSWRIAACSALAQDHSPPVNKNSYDQWVTRYLLPLCENPTIQKAARA